MGMDQDDIVVIPLSAYQRRISGNQDVAIIQVSVQQGYFKKTPVCSWSSISCLVEKGWGQAIDHFPFRRPKQGEKRASPPLLRLYNANIKMTE